jgi:hypothetical protein
MTRTERWLAGLGTVGLLASLAAAWVFWVLLTQPVALARALDAGF